MHPKRLRSRILGAVARANRAYGLVAPGDRILVAMSGGKDSHTLLWALESLKSAATFALSLVPYHLDQGQPGHDAAPLATFLAARGHPFEIEVEDTYSRVVEKTAPHKAYCSLCSRFRRAILYRAAARHGCNKVALGHHRDDLIETLLLSIFFSGQIKSMPPKLTSDAGEEQVIRPLCLVPEDDCAELAALIEAPILPCRLCGSQERQRAFIKKLLTDLGAHMPHLKGNILAALGNLRPEHLMDPRHNPLLAGEHGLPPAPSPSPAGVVGLTRAGRRLDVAQDLAAP